MAINRNATWKGRNQMVLIAMLVCGVATGLACRSWRQASVITLVVFAAGLAVQTPIVASESAFESGSDIVIYALIQVVSLAAGLAIARFLNRRRQSRSAMA